MANPDRLSKYAQRVLANAQREAERMKQAKIGSEHLLLGLLQEKNCSAELTLRGLGVTVPNVRGAIPSWVVRGRLFPFTKPRLAEDTQRALELAAKEMDRATQQEIGTEHLLLALLCQKDGVAAGILEGMGAVSYTHLTLPTNREV